ncbi:hypothetical protein ARMA_0869 [Ardenticatena maritima]|uniref:ABC transporter domain-containing protein n=1 Tax=Ardenticatena maritima TaxID=872965 RepID=A0A0M8K8H8_9CHLR|nr:metal ABC transporter ATP-binding protein [Ardenticatena maritima]KPL87185.1 hypothetical protein SE16_11705 [Ardenticatena maritima]GAP62446.1 hypothetical protein ARMA_0869 [Ardenticatena maritima]
MSVAYQRSPVEVSEPAMPAVEAAHVSVRYGARVALEDVTFSVAPATRVAIVGPNGAGKSTLLKVVAGLIQPTEGTVRVFGRSPRATREIAYVPQHKDVDWRFPLTVYDVVMMGRAAHIGLLRRPRREDHEAVRLALAEVDLLDLADRQIGQLSGGQQQRMFIARALVQEARIVLMDEPLNGLDIPSQRMVFRIWDMLRDRGVTLLVATHDLDQANTMFDRVMVLNRRLLAYGAPRAVFTPATLSAAYGPHLHLVPAEDESVMVLSDTCCEGGVHQ